MNFSSYLVHIPLYFGSSNFPLSNQGCYQWSTIYWDVKWKANVSIKHPLIWAVKGVLKNKNIILIGKTLIETRHTNTAVADYCMSYFKTWNRSTNISHSSLRFCSHVRLCFKYFSFPFFSSVNEVFWNTYKDDLFVIKNFTGHKISVNTPPRKIKFYKMSVRQHDPYNRFLLLYGSSSIVLVKVVRFIALYNY